MVDARRYSLPHRCGAGLFVWFALHWVPLPCPVRPVKSLFPPEHWESLGFFDPPWGLGYSFYSVLFVRYEVRNLGWVMLLYEPLLLVVALAILRRFPHRLIGRD